MKKESKVLFIVVACLIMFGSLIGCEAVSTVDSTSADESVNAVVENTIVEAQQSEETTVVEESSIKESSSIGETTTAVSEESSIEETIQPSSEFIYTDWDGNVLTIEDMQEYLIDCDRSLTVAEILELSPEDLVNRYDDVMVIEKAREYNDYGDEGFWDDEEEFIVSNIAINSVNDYKQWFRNAKEGEQLVFNSSINMSIIVDTVYGNNNEIRIKIVKDLDYAYFYVVLPDNCPNLISMDRLSKMEASYSGERSDFGDAILYCSSLSLIN